MLEVDDVDLGVALWINIDIELIDELPDGFHGFFVGHDDQGVRALIGDDLLDVLAL